KKDAGSTIELSFETTGQETPGSARVRSRVIPAHDPPLRGAAEDCVKRTESYVKDFRPLKLGKLELPAGNGKLVLKALEKPGEEVMEVRLLFFTRTGK
ncbi:MAG: hypothetical protein VYD81_03580, partial [Planctomycetota bacterium]|nr:hypothetical protein [Planctomycetota bacterium]